MIIFVTVNREFSEEVGSPNLFGDNPLPPMRINLKNEYDFKR